MTNLNSIPLLNPTMPKLPDHVSAYRRTPTFVAETIPAGFRKEHNTKAGVWGVIHILSGALLYHVQEAKDLAIHVLGPNKRGVIRPEQLHHIEAPGDVEFYVEFFRA